MAKGRSGDERPSGHTGHTLGPTHFSIGSSRSLVAALKRNHMGLVYPVTT
jgi:hypothetical protein